MKSYINDEFGNTSLKRIIIAFTGLALISYLSGVNWKSHDYSEDIEKYVVETNARTPIKHSEAFVLDSVSFDGKSIIHQYFSEFLSEKLQLESGDLKRMLSDYIKEKLKVNDNLFSRLSKTEIKIIIHVKSVNPDNNFQFMIDKNFINDKMSVKS